jgi:hypothetical protein
MGYERLCVIRRMGQESDDCSKIWGFVTLGDKGSPCGVDGTQGPEKLVRGIRGFLY